MKLSAIHPNAKNPRIIKDDRFKKMVSSIKEFPAMMELRPIVVDTDGTILGGNMRYKAIKELGMKEIPDTWVKSADKLTDDEKKRFIVEDNIQFGDWDEAVLSEDYSLEDLQDWGVELGGYGVEQEKPDNDPFDDKGITAENKFGVMVLCENEGAQEKVFNDLSAAGYNCKVLVV